MSRIDMTGIKPQKLSQKKARQIWLNASLLNSNLTLFQRERKDRRVTKIIDQLGYLQIDTIFVIERCHHHILFNRYPEYLREDLQKCQSKTKSVFEYWTHALAYVPTNKMSFYTSDMRSFYKSPSKWYDGVTKNDLKKLMQKIRNEGPISLRDMDDQIEGRKNEWWTSSKPSKKILQYGFYSGKLAISERVGMLKKYELFDRHFSDLKLIESAKPKQRLNYLIDRALTSQGVVSLESICHLNNSDKKDVFGEIESRVKKKSLIRVDLEGKKDWAHWMTPHVFENLGPAIADDQAFILSPFDPLMIQRDRSEAILDYKHIFEAYVPLQKRKYGYFTLPVLIGDQIVAGLDLKTDRQNKKLLIQSWHWFQKKSKSHQKLIEKSLDRFEKFQLA